MLVTASFMSLFAVVAALHRASGATFRLEITLIAVALTAVVLSWFVVNSVFLLGYAHLYYGGTRVGGVEFPGERAPAYFDFAYLAFVFDLAIIATTINLVAGSSEADRRVRRARRSVLAAQSAVEVSRAAVPDIQSAPRLGASAASVPGCAAGSVIGIRIHVFEFA